ncbi:MAG: alcohol dehydrogenase-like regulatory protein ErcA [Syntrophomonadaceae bacterium]
MTDMQESLELRKFVAPEIVSGVGARFMVDRYIKNFGIRKVLVVSDPGVIEAGWTNDVIWNLKEAGVSYSLFSDVSPNPRAEQVMAGAEVYQNEECHAIVAVGGGSPMDCAKGIGIVSTNSQHIIEFEGADQVSIPGPPLICIPTTSGSSADVSQFAIITNKQRNVKMAIVSKMLVPDVALIDPETLLTMPAYLAACTGMDALTHAIEAFVSNASSPLTDVLALEAISLVNDSIIQSLDKPDDMELRARMMRGSMLAGLAFSNAILGAVHAMAHSLGGLLDLPHGECNAILLRHVIAFNYDEAADRYQRIARAMGLPGGDEKQVKKGLLDAIYRLQTAVGITRTLGELGVKPGDVPQLAKNAIMDACMATNPRGAGQRDIEVVYEEAL